MELTEAQYLAHYGKKGMKWGVRNTAKVQKRVDRIRRVASGTASKSDRRKAALLDVAAIDLIRGKGLRTGAQKTLDRNEATKKKIVGGKRKAYDILSPLNGVTMRDLSFDYDKG